MINWAKNLPLLFTLVFGVAYFSWCSFAVVMDIFGCLLDSRLARGVLMSFLFGCGVSVGVVGLHTFFRKELRLLGASLVYAGAFVTCWLCHYGLPFLGLLPRHFSFGKDYAVLFITSAMLLTLHYLRLRFRRRLSRSRNGIPRTDAAPLLRIWRRVQKACGR